MRGKEAVTNFPRSDYAQDEEKAETAHVDAVEMDSCANGMNIACICLTLKGNDAG